MKAQFVPIRFLHQLRVHPASQVLLRQLPARGRIHALVTQAFHVLDHVVATFTVVVQWKGSFLWRLRDEDLLSAHRHDASSSTTISRSHSVWMATPA